MMVAAGVNIAQHGDVDEPAERGGDSYEPLGDKLFDDSLILREAFQRFHDTALQDRDSWATNMRVTANQDRFRLPSCAAIHGILLLVNVSVNNNVVNGSIGMEIRDRKGIGRRDVR